MVDLTVIRGAGAHPGEDIVDPLVTTVPCALSRGRAELDARASGATLVTITTAYVAGRRLGQLIEAHDVESGVVYRGKIVGLAHRLESPARTTEVTLERPFQELAL
jgi:hypothetical protein